MHGELESPSESMLLKIHIDLDLVPSDIIVYAGPRIYQPGNDRLFFYATRRLSPEIESIDRAS